MSIHYKIDIFDSVISENLTEISTDFLEAGLDQLIENDFLKDIPIIGTAFKSYSLAKNITENFFAKKLLRFLFHLKDIPKVEREKFVTELETAKESKKVSEKLLNILNRLDDLNKASTLGKLFKFYLKGDINQSDFFRLSSFVDRIYIEDLIVLFNSDDPDLLSNGIKEVLAQVGLFNRQIKDNREFEQRERIELGKPNYTIPATFEYTFNKFGELLIKYGK